MIDKLEAQRTQLANASLFLQRALRQPENEFQRAAVIQAFETCYELAWKYLKTVVENEGGLVSSPRAAFREAARLGIIDNPEEWFVFLQSRNLTVHTYNENVAAQIYDLVKQKFAASLRRLIEKTADQS